MIPPLLPLLWSSTVAILALLAMTPRPSAPTSSSPLPAATTAAAAVSSRGSDQQQQPRENRHRRRLWLVVDFDGTCTVRDTTPILPHLASSCLGEDDERRRSRLEAFEELEGRYFELYNEAKDRIFGDGKTTTPKTTTTTTALTLDDALESLDAASTEVTRRVSDSGVLAGISDCPVALEAALRGVAEVAAVEDDDHWSSAASLRPGCVEALATAVHRGGWHLGVLSINWCPPLIEAALLRRVRREVEALAKEEEEDSSFSSLLQRRLSERNIWSNAVNAEGVVDLSIPGAVAKREKIAHLKKKTKSRVENDNGEEEALSPLSSSPSLSSLESSSSSPSSPLSSSSSSSSLVVYVGDSSTDLLGLLEADVGIFIGRPSGTTAAIANKWGVPLVPLAEREEAARGTGVGRRNDKEQSDDNSLSSLLVEADGGTIWVATHWDEIDALLGQLSRRTGWR